MCVSASVWVNVDGRDGVVFRASRVVLLSAPPPPPPPPPPHPTPNPNSPPPVVDSQVDVAYGTGSRRRALLQSEAPQRSVLTALVTISGEGVGQAIGLGTIVAEEPFRVSWCREWNE